MRAVLRLSRLLFLGLALWGLVIGPGNAPAWLWPVTGAVFAVLLGFRAAHHRRLDREGVPRPAFT